LTWPSSRRALRAARPNGAGKTTTVKILTTLLLPTAGTARVLGHDVVSKTNDVRRRIGFVVRGERGLYWRLSGYDNLRYFADLYRIPPQVSKRRIAELLRSLGLRAASTTRFERYSRGMSSDCTWPAAAQRSGCPFPR